MTELTQFNSFENGDDQSLKELVKNRLTEIYLLSPKLINYIISESKNQYSDNYDKLENIHGFESRYFQDIEISKSNEHGESELKFRFTDQILENKHDINYWFLPKYYAQSKFFVKKESLEQTQIPTKFSELEFRSIIENEEERFRLAIEYHLQDLDTYLLDGRIHDWNLANEIDVIYSIIRSTTFHYFYNYILSEPEFQKYQNQTHKNRQEIARIISEFNTNPHWSYRLLGSNRKERDKKEIIAQIIDQDNNDCLRVLEGLWSRALAVKYQIGTELIEFVKNLPGTTR